MKRSFAILGLAAAFMRLGVVPAHPHDQYTGLQRNGTYGEQSPCCGNTDCEALEIDDAIPQPDGSALIFSHRHNVQILVAANRITPVALPKSPDGKFHPVHWCGTKRTPNYIPYGYAERPDGIGDVAKPDAEQPDPAFITYCAFLAPGGV
jgi:hypothetical protein